MGGYLFATTDAQHFRIAYMENYVNAASIGSKQAIFGGIVSAGPFYTVPWARIAGYDIGRRGREAFLGAYALGRPINLGFSELHARTLVKVRSSGIVGQDLNLDAKLILKSASNSDFNAKII